jgi:collagenase-like PrtC family protease
MPICLTSGFVVINTILYDKELEVRRKLIHEYDIKVDALYREDIGNYGNGFAPS